MQYFSDMVHTYFKTHTTKKRTEVPDLSEVMEPKVLRLFLCRCCMMFELAPGCMVSNASAPRRTNVDLAQCVPSTYSAKISTL